MTGYYHAPDRAALLHQRINAWLGTPFRPHAGVCQAGADCLHLALALDRECGLDLQVPVPEYGMFDGACRADDGPIMAWLRASPRFSQTWADDHPWPPPLALGDHLCLRIGRSVHHLGVMADARRFVHSLHRYGVILSSITDTTFRKRLAAVFRPLA